MGRRSITDGVVGKGDQRIQYDFRLNGVRFRPTLRAIPTEANLRRAREHLKVVRGRIRLGTFSFIDEFTDFRDLHKVLHHSPYRTCDHGFDEYLSCCDSRRGKHDLSFATVTGYRKALDSIWRPKLGSLAQCWRKSSERLGLRFRRPYCARHTSVSWNLMIGKNPRFVSRQHGHSVTTMWRTYAAWMEGALETDIALIQAAMNRDGPATDVQHTDRVDRECTASGRIGHSIGHSARSAGSSSA